MSDRALVSLNPPNFITIGLMAIGSFILFGLVWQLVSRFLPRDDGGLHGGAEDVTISTGGDIDAA